VPGQQQKLRLSIKYLDDVGLIGLPNVGKSTLLSILTDAHPKIGDYPFTTLNPNLGLARLQDYRTFVVADIPGLIKDAHKGRGLGFEFLRHIQRTRVLVFLIDVSAADAKSQLDELKEELGLYDPELLKKPQIVVLNKIDLLEKQNKLKFNEKNQECYQVSALTGEGIDKLASALAKILDELKNEE